MLMLNLYCTILIRHQHCLYNTVFCSRKRKTDDDSMMIEDEQILLPRQLLAVNSVVGRFDRKRYTCTVDYSTVL